MPVHHDAVGALRKPADTSSMTLVLFLARSAPWLLLRATVCSVLSGLGASLMVALINQSLTADAEQLSRLGLQFGALAVAMFALRWFTQAQFVELSQSTLARLRAHITAHLAEAPYHEIEARGPARLMALLTEDVNTVSQFFVTLPRIMMNGAVVVGCMSYLGLLSWKALGFAVGMLVLGSVVYQWAGHRASVHLRRARAGEDALFEHFRALLLGAKELKLNRRRRRAFVSSVLKGSIEAVRADRTRGLQLYVASGSWGKFLFFVAIGGVLFGLGSGGQLDSRVMSGYALIFLYMMLPLESLLDAISDVSRTRVSLERIQELGADRGSVPGPTADPLAAEPFESVCLREVTHRYHRDGEDGVFELGPINLELRAGEIVFLVGGNGSGKTTLAKLLVGLYAPETGEVQLNGEVVRADDGEAYRQSFSAVFSDFHLFESLLGLDGEASEEQARSLLGMLELEHKVQIRGGVFSTTALSRGQQKRLALLVACLEDRPVYVFDEWAADQDPVYKDVFYREVLPSLKARGKTVFVITHDDRYFDLADRCIKLDAGKFMPLDRGASVHVDRRPRVAVFS